MGGAVGEGVGVSVAVGIGVGVLEGAPGGVMVKLAVGVSVGPSGVGVSVTANVGDPVTVPRVGVIVGVGEGAVAVMHTLNDSVAVGAFAASSKVRREASY